jgi:hypothetical protein
VRKLTTLFALLGPLAFAGSAASVSACAKAQTTPVGRLGQVDLKTKLPEGISRGPDDAPAEHERSAEVCRGDSSPGVQVKVKWETFSKKDDHYISSYEVEVVKPQDGMSVHLAEPAPVGNANVQPDAKSYVGITTITIMCKSDAAELKGVIQIRGDGKVGGGPPAK